MKTPSRLSANFKSILFFSLLSIATFSMRSQTDTLHLYFKGLQTPILDSNEAKIGAWAKSLKGRHVNIKVLAYYEKSEFKKYSQDRCDEMFIAINRKARDLVTITSNQPVKGEKSQRSTVDVVYTFVGGSDKPAAEKEKDKPVANTKKETTEKPKETDKPVVTKKETDNSSKPKGVYDPNYIYDTVYVNGVMKVSKKKKPVIDPNYKYDTLYINGTMKVTKTKIKK